MPLVDVLPETFTAYCKSIPGAEPIDELHTPPGLKKADFLFNDRTIVCEVKSLQTETMDKIEPILRAASFQLTPGETYRLNNLLHGHPDETRLFRRCLDAITTGLKDAIDEANRQIRDSKIAFSLEAADGLLVILHGKVRVLNPPLVMKRMAVRFQKKNPDGSPYLRHITGVILVSELWKYRRNGVGMAVNFLERNPPVPELFGVTEFMRELDLGWAAWTGRKHHEIPAAEVSDDCFQNA